MDWTWCVVVAVLLLPWLAACAGEANDGVESPPVTVRTVRLARTAFRGTLRLSGVVRPGGEVTVAAPVRGRLRYPARFARGLEEGATVAAGELLAMLDNEEVEHQQAMARLRSRAADAELARWERAFAAGVAPETDVVRYREEAAAARQELATAERQQARLDLRAPVAGALEVSRAFPAGAEVESGAVLARILGGGRQQVEVAGAASDHDLLAPGLPVRFLAAGEARELGSGVVRDVAAGIDAGGVLRVLADVRDGDRLPPPGEGVDVEVQLARHSGALVVPRAALVVDDGGTSVFVVTMGAGLTAHRRQVQPGISAGDDVEVLDGLRPGDRVVVDGVGFLSDGARVAELEGGAGAP